MYNTNKKLCEVCVNYGYELQNGIFCKKDYQFIYDYCKGFELDAERFKKFEIPRIQYYSSCKEIDINSYLSDRNLDLTPVFIILAGIFSYYHLPDYQLLIIVISISLIIFWLSYFIKQRKKIKYTHLEILKYHEIIKNPDEILKAWIDNASYDEYIDTRPVHKKINIDFQ